MDASGLRFDIYERVHLPDDVAAIGQLEEIELVPHMQAHNQEDQVLLKGHLLLTGVYQGVEQDPSFSRLEHWIPVEISLPPNRVQRVEDLAVEIDNFDVDLLSTRSLNVTGVLALRGLMAEPQQIPVWRDDSFTVVHQAPREAALEPDSGGPDEEASADRPGLQETEFEDGEPAEPADASAAFEPHAASPATTVPFYALPESWDEGSRPYSPIAKPEPAAGLGAPSPAAGAESPPPSAPPPSAPLSFAPLSGIAPEWPTDAAWGDISNRKSELEPEQQREPEPEAEPAFEFASESESEQEHEPYVSEAPPFFANHAEEQPELKVALGGKPLNETPPRTPSGAQLLSQLGDKGASREAEKQAGRSAIAEAGPEESASPRASTGDELEWTKLFLVGGVEAQPFRKVRMCIVQREETLESIAARYNVQVRELQLRNRLSDPYLSEGQVLYIP